MTYKIDSIVNKITSKVILVYEDGTTQEYADGTVLSEASFDKRYRIESISASDNKIEISIAEIVNNYTDKEMTTLFDGN